MFDFLSKKFSGIFSHLTGKDRLTDKNLEETLEKVKDSLLQADVPYDLVNAFIKEVKEEVIGQKVFATMDPSEQFVKIVHDKIVNFLGGAYLQDSFQFQIPSIVMMMGLQGSGKTTTIAKLAYFIKQQAEKRNKTRKILFSSIDFYRPAAIDQLEILASQVGVDFYRSAQVDSLRATKDIMNYYKNEGYDHLLFDTAGRLHIDQSMMHELKEVKKIVAPRYSCMVLDAMTGQESLAVAKTFNDEIGFDFAILSKMDSDSRGGAAFSFRYALKKPLLFVGVGEKIDNLELFRPERVAQRMLGMGDILTLVEKAEEKIQQSEQESLKKSLKSNRFTLVDFESQLSMVSKLGSLGSVMKFIPGMANMKISEEELKNQEREIKIFRAIISSMTRKERLTPEILDGSRKKRVAKGAGVEVAEVNLLLQRFEQSKQFAKLLKKKRFF
ncbi:signal recognition particle protein [Candidatus Dependentiae bacterium]|nr:signal recognition particle protein [Candidatus Dependentiae bacterium]